MSPLADLSDLELLSAWRRGDGTAGETLFERHYARVERYFANKVRSGSEDLVQNTFVALVENKEAFRADASFKTYLFAVCRNLLRMHYRTQRRHADRFDYGSVAAADINPGPGTLLGKRQEERLLLLALRAIPVEHQELLELYYWESQKAREIGELLDLPEGTVRTRLRKAKQLLEAELAALSESPQLLESTLGSLEKWAQGLRERPNSG